MSGVTSLIVDRNSAAAGSGSRSIVGKRRFVSSGGVGGMTVFPSGPSGSARVPSQSGRTVPGSGGTVLDVAATGAAGAVVGGDDDGTAAAVVDGAGPRSVVVVVDT